MAAGYAELSPKARVHFMTHVVRRGNGSPGLRPVTTCPSSDIRAANPRVNGSRLKAGSRLVIPAVAIPSALAIRAADRAVPSGGQHGRVVATHRVRSGETLIGIARRYRVSLRALRRVNALPVEYTLRAGKRFGSPANPTLNLSSREPIPCLPNPASLPASSAARATRPISSRAAMAILVAMVILIVALTGILVETTWGHEADRVELLPQDPGSFARR